MSFDYTTLVTDRTEADVTALKALLAKPMAMWTEAEKAALLDGMKGGYSASDLNRVSACVADLVQRFGWAGYAVPGYERLKIERSGNRLPEGYTEVEYIESSGTQYVDTGFVPDANTKVIMDFQLTASGTNNFALFAVTGQYSFRYFGTNSVFRSNGGNNVDFPSDIDVLARHTVMKTATETSIDDTYSVETTVGTVELSLYLLAQHQASAVSNYAKACLYSCQIYDNGTLIRDFVPCIDPSGAAGLYDLVNGKFYGNAGTGTFTAGDTVAAASESDEELDPYTWYEDDAPTESQMEQYRGNVAAVRRVLKVLSTTPETPADMRRLTYQEANDIEKILLDIFTQLTILKTTLIPCGEAICGGDNL